MAVFVVTVPLLEENVPPTCPPSFFRAPRVGDAVLGGQLQEQAESGVNQNPPNPNQR